MQYITVLNITGLCLIVENQIQCMQIWFRGNCFMFSSFLMVYSTILLHSELISIKLLKAKCDFDEIWLKNTNTSFSPTDAFEFCLLLWIPDTNWKFNRITSSIYKQRWYTFEYTIFYGKSIEMKWRVFIEIPTNRKPIWT